MRRGSNSIDTVRTIPQVIEDAISESLLVLWHTRRCGSEDVVVVVIGRQTSSQLKAGAVQDLCQQRHGGLHPLGLNARNRRW